MVVIDLDEVIEVADGAMQVEREIKVLFGILLFSARSERDRLPPLVFEDAHDVSVVASRAKEEEVIRFPGLASKFSAGDFRGPVVRFAVIKGHAPFLSEWLLASILLYGSPLGGSEADAPILVS